VAVIHEILNPFAFARVEWLAPDLRGRRFAEPNSPVYAATCYPVQPEPTGATLSEYFSVLLQRDSAREESIWKLGFLSPEIAARKVHNGGLLVITEGKHVVSIAEIITLAGDPIGCLWQERSIVTY
jgi:hypothetical protein